MKIIHSYGDKRAEREVLDRSDATMMAGSCGSYLWTGAEAASRYQGWFFGFGDNSLIKVVDDIRPKGRGQVLALENDFVTLSKSSREFKETFFLFDRQSLVYELDKVGQIEIFFDVKDPYRCPEFGRNYKVWREDGIIVTSFKQESEFVFPEVFIAVCGTLSGVELKEGWVKRDYFLDRLRADLPYERWVLKPGDFCAKRIAVGAGFSKDEAIWAACNALRGFEAAVTERQKNILRHERKTAVLWPQRNPSESIFLAKSNAANALKILYSKKSGQPALRAGLPWFFQVWRRDEAVSLGGLAYADRNAACEMFWRQLGELEASGGRYDDSADAAGWLFLRARRFIRRGWMASSQIKKIFDVLETSIEKSISADTKNFLAVCGPKLTWMDSLSRAGAAIELQALRLNMYSLAAEITSDEMKKNNFLGLEKELAAQVRKLFWVCGRIADNYDTGAQKADFRGRPNIFLAAYAYPELFRKSEWNVSFDRALKCLWLDWGGLSTLDKDDPEFCPRDTGIEPAAYHNGDSWFWVNNIAAVVLHRLNPLKYKHYVEKIFKISATDILWNGAAGCGSEISSAELYLPAGCANQAWSNATFLELCRELKI